MGVMHGVVPARMRHITVNGKEAARAFPIKRNNRRHAAHLPSAFSPISALPSPSSSSSSLPLLVTATRPLLSILCLRPTAMAPKTGKGNGKGAAKDVVEKEAPENEAAVQRAQFVYFSPSSVDVFHLKDVFRPLWAAETTGHPATRIIPADCGEAGPKRCPFFVDFFSCGLCPPFSDFFNDVMRTFGFCLLDLTRNAVAYMGLFAHLCEGFVGVLPSKAIFLHYFSPRLQPGGA